MDLIQKLPAWLNWENVQDLIMILTFLMPFIPAKYLKLLGPFVNLLKYLTANFGHAESVDEIQHEENKKERKLRRRKKM